MNKEVNIVVNQIPVSVSFVCPYCELKREVEYWEFKRITGKGLHGFVYEQTYFKCPKCEGDLEIKKVEFN